MVPSSKHRMGPISVALKDLNVSEQSWPQHVETAWNTFPCKLFTEKNVFMEMYHWLKLLKVKDSLRVF